MVRTTACAMLAMAIGLSQAMAQPPTLDFMPPGPSATPFRASLGAPSSVAPPATVVHAKSPPPPPAFPTRGGPNEGYTGLHSTLPRFPNPSGDPSSPLIQNPSGCDSCAAPKGCPVGLLDNLSIFAGVDHFKTPVDLGINSNLGYRVGVNWGIPLNQDAEGNGWGIQVGTALNHAENSMRFMRFLDGTRSRDQHFASVGLFNRQESGLSVGFTYDFLWDEYYDDMTLGQWRWQAGVPVSSRDEIGIWGTVRANSDSASFLGVNLAMQPINQWNLYWRRVWDNDVVTRVWVGLAEDHGRVNVFLPPEAEADNPFTFGGEIFVPLSAHLALFGEAHVITPGDSGVVAATIGVAFFPGTAQRGGTNRFAPFLPLANNQSFAVDARR